MLQLVSTGSLDNQDCEQMQVSRKRFRLAKLLRSTEEILNRAQQGDWETVEKLEHLRQMELAICFAETDHDDSPEIIEALAALVHMNKEITRLVEEARNRLVDQQQAKEVRQQAARSYEWED
ncbi:MAG: flagellar protein FliT [Gammaproteobacteria bacterium]|nr:flagellar protein FliT [Gammaproteobacteria bacterium]